MKDKTKAILLHIHERGIEFRKYSTLEEAQTVMELAETEENTTTDTVNDESVPSQRWHLVDLTKEVPAVQTKKHPDDNAVPETGEATDPDAEDMVDEREAEGNSVDIDKSKEIFSLDEPLEFEQLMEMDGKLVFAVYQWPNLAFSGYAIIDVERVWDKVIVSLTMKEGHSCTHIRYGEKYIDGWKKDWINPRLAVYTLPQKENFALDAGVEHNPLSYEKLLEMDGKPVRISYSTGGNDTPAITDVRETFVWLSKSQYKSSQNVFFMRRGCVEVGLHWGYGNDQAIEDSGLTVFPWY